MWSVFYNFDSIRNFPYALLIHHSIVVVAIISEFIIINVFFKSYPSFAISFYMGLSHFHSILFIPTSYNFFSTGGSFCLVTPYTFKINTIKTPYYLSLP